MGPTGEGAKGPVSSQYRANGEAAQANAKSFRLATQSNAEAAQLDIFNAQMAESHGDLISAGMDQAAADLALKLAESYRAQADIEENAADEAFKNAAMAAGPK